MERLVHVIQDGALRQLHGDFAPNGVKSAVYTQNRTAPRFTLPHPLLVAPVEITHGSSTSVVHVAPEHELPTDTPDLWIGKVLDQATYSILFEDLSDIDKQ